MSFIMASLFIVLLVGTVGCQAASAVSSISGSSLTSILEIPRDVQRIAVLYPKSGNPDVAEAYNRLEGATFRLKVHRPELKIVDRLNLAAALAEHRLQLAGTQKEGSVIRIGRVLGVDSILIYRIAGPSNRDRMWAQSYRDLPPITVTSKVIRIETAEVLYHRVIVARIEDPPSWWWQESIDYQRLSREAIERGIIKTVSELAQAFK